MNSILFFILIGIGVIGIIIALVFPYAKVIKFASTYKVTNEKKYIRAKKYENLLLGIFILISTLLFKNKIIPHELSGMFILFYCLIEAIISINIKSRYIQKL